MTPLYKTTLVIWSEEETGDQTMKRLGSDVDSDFTYCSSRDCVFVEDPEKDPDLSILALFHMTRIISRRLLLEQP
jgi:hypothetical protein